MDGIACLARPGFLNSDILPAFQRFEHGDAFRFHLLYQAIQTL